MTGRKLGLLPAEGCNGRGGVAGGGDLRLPSPEHSRTVYCDQAHYGPVSGGGAEAGAKGGQAVVGQDRLDLEGMWTAAWEAEREEGEEETDGTATDTDD